MPTSLLYYRSKYIIIQAVVIGALFMFAYILDMKNSVGLFYFLIFWNIITYSFVLCNELVKSKDFHPLIIFALITLQYCGFSAIPAAGLVSSGADIYMGATRITDYMTLGYLYLTLEHYLIFCGYFIYDNSRLKKIEKQTTITDGIVKSGINLYKVGLYNYIAVLLLRLVDKMVPLASLSSLLDVYSERGYLVSLSILSYSMLLSSSRKSRKLFWGITVLEIVLVLGDGMKQAVITPLIPYLIYLILAYKRGIINISSLSFLTKCAIIVFFIVGFVFPYISSFREIANEQQKEWKDISVSEALSRYADNMLLDNNHDKQSGLEYFLSRAGSIGSNSFSIGYADKNGISSEYFLYTTASIIPRIFWADKPQLKIGSTAYHMSLGYTYEEALRIAQEDKKSSSITLGFIGSSYLAFGVIGALFFSLLAGNISARIWYFVKSRQYNVMAIWFFYVLIQTIFVDYESFIDCGLNFYMWAIVYIILIKLSEPYLFKWKNNVTSF